MFGKHAHLIANAARDAGHPIPDDAIAPDLFDESLFAYVALGELFSERQIGLGMGPIPWGAIDAYARRYHLDDIDEFERFVVLIRAGEGAMTAHQQSGADG